MFTDLTMACVLYTILKKSQITTNSRAIQSILLTAPEQVCRVESQAGKW